MTIILDKVAEEAVTRAVNKLVQTVADNLKLVSGIESDIIHLTSDIETFNARLMDASMNPRANEFELLDVVLKKFRFVTDEAQDVITEYITLKKKHEDNVLAKLLDKNPLPFCGFCGLCGKVKGYASKIQLVRTMVNTIRQDHEVDLRCLTNYQNHDDHTHLQDVPMVEGDCVVGFDSDLKTIKDRLIAAPNGFIVIPIVGIPGCGKTTFAKMVFEDSVIRDEFIHCIWVNASRGFNRKQKFIDILNQITDEHTANFSDMSEDALGQKISDFLTYKKYFIVVDNVWSVEEWKSLKIAFPNNLEGSRVLLTTRYDSVAGYIGGPYILQDLSAEDGWLLLQRISFGGEECKNDSLLECGKRIVKKCNALPLALVMVGGILRKSRATVEWKRVAKNPFLEINQNDQSYHKLIMLSYDHLPRENLKNCFLYFASFPMGHEVGARKLIHLWIAEQFIPTKDGYGLPLNVEVEAHKYLTDLIDRNLVKVIKKRANGQVKTCRIHDSLHEFCKREAAGKNLFRIMDEIEKSDLITILPRRLCFHSSIVADSFVARKNPFYMFFFSCCNTKKSSRLSSKRVHSLLLSSSNKTEIPLTTEKQLERRDSYLTENQLTEKQLEDRVIGLTENHLAAISNSFPHLMVLDIEAIKFELLPEEIYGLYHLRYLAVSTDLSALPKQFGNLHSLETLVLKTTQSELAIGEAIWKMEKLRHMHTNTSAKLLSPPGTSKNSFGSTDIQPLASSTEKLRHVLTDTFAKLLGLPRTSKSSFQSTKIHTLSTISPASCTEEIFSKTPHLQKLGVRGDLASLLKKNQQGMCLFDNLQKLDYLENLKLHGQSRSQKILKVPTLEKFPRKLRKLTLSNTLFVWSDIVILGSLEELEVLKLDKNAFRGNTWNWYLPEDVVFNQLQYLRIGNTNLVIWNFTQKDKFPNLERLVLRNCTKLKQIPSAFGDVSSLKVMELFHVSDDAYHSARSLHQETNKRFELLITSLTLQEKDQQVHNQTHCEEDVNTSGFNIPSTSTPSQAEDTVKEPIVADFDNEVGIIKKRLTGGSKNLAIIPIVGKRGIGKTRLAAMIFKEPELEYKFFIRLWVDVSESYSRKKIFLNILSMLITDQVEEYDDMIEEELVKKIEKLLYGGKYLIVIDDLRKEHDWEGLKKVFPDNMNGSRILITTRNSQVASDADFDLASDADSDLGSDADSDLKPVKLEGEAASNEDGELAETAQLNYHKLDSKMKDCFQYFAAFPEELVIDARKLMHMWIAEGLVETSEEEPGLVETSEEEPGLVETSEEEPGLVETSEEEPEPEPEHTAETYLNALVENHLLIASKRRADGGIKTVSIHYLLLDFCRNEAANQNLFRTLEGRLGGVSNGYRRLSVHSSLLQQDTSEIINAVTPRENVQSFLSFSSDATQIPEAVMVMAAIPNAFPNLKVLDIGSIELFRLPKQLYRLHHLSYLSISTHLNHLPKEFRNLRQLQVLIFHTTQSALKIEADIWNMPNLRHLHTNTPAKLPNPTRRCRFRSSSGTGSACITTLSTISPTSCRKKILDKATNLRKLRIRGNLGELMETRKGGISLFDNLKQLSHLQNLKLLNSAIPGQAASRLQSIPQHDKFPQKLRKLTLSNTSLEWENMYVLGKLEELEVLKLEEYAFRGEFWEIDENFVFKALRFLRIGRTDLVEWVAYPSSFPVLETLAIRHCTRLEALPPKLDSMYNLKLLELYCTTKMAAISAREIKRRLDDLGDEEFNLSIYPPNH